MRFGATVTAPQPFVRPMSNGKQKNWLERIGCQISAWMSDISAHPFAQIAVVLICVTWFALGLATDVLTAVLSILAISLTQMVLNRQNEREMEAHRRDVAMHAKLDELVLATKHARNKLAGIEDELEEEEIQELKDEAKQAVEDGSDAIGLENRAEAKKEITEATRKVIAAEAGGEPAPDAG